MKRLHLCCLLAAAGLIAKSNASLFDDFNTPGSFQLNYNVYQNTTTPGTVPYTQSTSSGVAGSGAIDVLPSTTTGVVADSTAVYKNQSFDFSTSGSTLTISAFMKAIAPVETNNRELQLGFVNETTSGMNGNAGLAFTSLRFNPTAIGSMTFSPQWQTKVAAGTTVVNTTVTPTITFVQNDWYLMSLTFVNNGGGSIGGSGFVQDMGVDGTTAGTVTPITSANLTSADIAADATVFAAFRGFQRDGLAAIDNFSAVPEPSTLALFGAASAGLLILRRRRS